MFNPVDFSLKIQQVAMNGAAASSRMMLTNYLRFIEQQNILLQNAMSHRRDEGVRSHKKAQSNPARKTRVERGRGTKSPCCGPDLLDHYGKRAHDVDIEHI